MKFKQSLAAFLIAVFLGTYVVQWTSVSATEDPLEIIQGVVRVQVVEATEEAPSYYRFFIEQCNGAPCDFAVSKIGEIFQSDQSVRIEFIYLGGKVDFQSLVNKEVFLSGQSYNSLNLINEKGEAEVGFNQNFDVVDVLKVIQPPPTNFLIADPLTQPQGTLGVENIVVMPINFSVEPITPYSSQRLKDWVFTGPKSAKRFFEESSFYNQYTGQGFTIRGANDPTGDVTPFLTLTSDRSAPCEQNMGNGWRIEADSLAAQQGYPVVPNQIRILLFMPIPGCNLTAAATVGLFGSTNGVTYIFMQISASGSQTSLDTRFIDLIHETEHCLGQAAHSSGIQFEGGPIIEYGDDADPLGANSITLNNIVMRLKFHWYARSQLYPAMETRGTYRFKLQDPAVSTKGIGPNSPPIGAFIVLRDMLGNPIGNPTGKALILETRKNIGVFQRFGTDKQAYVQGLGIREVGLNLEETLVNSVIWDTTPGTPCCKDAPLVPDSSGSATWVKPINGVTITTYTGTSTGRWVEVTLGPNYPTAAALQAERAAIK